MAELLLDTIVLRNYLMQKQNKATDVLAFSLVMSPSAEKKEGNDAMHVYQLTQSVKV